MIRFPCKSCGQKLNVEEKHSGKRIKCPKCGSVGVVPGNSDKIKFHCESCGQSISVPQIHAGKKGKCPKCKTPIVVPPLEREPAGSAPPSPPIPSDADEDLYEDEPDLPEEGEGIDRRLIFAICGGAAVVVVGLIILVTVILPSGSGPVEEPDVSPRQQAADADSQPRPVASDTDAAGAFTLEPPKQDTLPKGSISSGQESLEQTKIAFISNRDGNAEIYVMNADGSEQENLTNSPADDGYPCWSRDGKRIAFVSDSDGDGNGEIHVMNSDGSRQKKLTNDPKANLCPVWSPDGKIAFLSLRDGNPEIYVMNADGSEQKRLTRNSLIDESPSWSPDGKRIAFMSKRDGIQDIHVMNADGSGQVNVTNSPVEDGFPFWSPDGKRIAFTSGTGRDTDIYVMNADGTGQKNVTDNPAMDGSGCYSPDGKKIVFWSTRSGNVDIFAMRVDGSEVENLTNNPSTDMFPSWSPFLGSEPMSAEEQESRRERQETADTNLRPQPVASEQSAAARNLDLKLRLEPGQKHRLRLHREYNSSYTIEGQQRDSSGALATELEFEVEQVDANGVMSLNVTHLRFHETTKMADGQKEYDSSKPGTLGNTHFGPIFSALTGQSFVAKVTPEGEIVEFEGLAEMYQRMAEPLVEYEDEATRQRYAGMETQVSEEDVKRQIDRANQKYGSREKRIEATREKLGEGPYSREENIREMLDEVIMSFPGGPVGIGDSWTAAPLSMGDRELGDYNYTLRETNQTAVLVDASLKIEVDDERPARADGSRGSSRTTLAGSGQGSLDIDPGTSWMLRKNVTVRYSGETKMAPSEQNPRGTTMAQSMENVTTVEPIQ